MDPENETTTDDTSAEPTQEQLDADLQSTVDEAIADVSVEPKEKTDDETTADETVDEGAKPGEQKPAAQQTPEEKAAADKVASDAAAAAKAKTPDPVNDPIPEGLKKETAERMKSLVTKVKEATTTVEKVTAERDEILGYIVETKATPEQYTQALGYLKAVNSGDPGQIREAIKTVQAELRALASQIGESVPGVDLLGEHQDLQDAVATGQISREHAEELAAARAQRATRDAQAAHTQQQTKVDREAETALNEGKASLNALESALKADPHYAAKREQLIPKLQAEFAKLHPSKWASRWAEEYAKIPNPTAKVVPIQKAPNQPLRPRQPAGGGVKAATSLEDAINQGIEEASGR